MSDSYLRDEVAWFAARMEERLRANDHKGGWAGMSQKELLQRLREEVGELELLLRSIGSGFRERPYLAEVQAECADVGNFAMMIADVFARL